MPRAVCRRSTSAPSRPPHALLQTCGKLSKRSENFSATGAYSGLFKPRACYPPNREGVPAMKRVMRAVTVLLPMLAVGCAQTPIEPSGGHIRTEDRQAEGAIPPPVQLTPL